MSDRRRHLPLAAALALIAFVSLLWSPRAEAAPKPGSRSSPEAGEAAKAAVLSATGAKAERELASLPTSRPRTRSVAIKEVLPSSVRISVTDKGKQIRSASGVVVASKMRNGVRVSHVITNAHVVEVEGGLADRIDVLLDRKGQTFQTRAKVLAVGKVPDVDLALLEVSGLEVRPAALIQDRDLELGDEVIAVGAPYGKGLSVSSGIVSQLDLDETGTAIALKTDAPIGYGASGGGIFRVSDGRLIAVVEGYRTVKVSFPVDGKNISFDVPMPGETFAAPAAKIRSFLEGHGLLELIG